MRVREMQREIEERHNERGVKAEEAHGSKERRAAGGEAVEAPDAKSKRGLAP